MCKDNFKQILVVARMARGEEVAGVAKFVHPVIVVVIAVVGANQVFVKDIVCIFFNWTRTSITLDLDTQLSFWQEKEVKNTDDRIVK